MKTLIYIISIALLSSCHASQSKKAVETMAVSGNCSSCESRIEKAAYNAGASSATWNSATNQLQVYYSTNKTSKEKIREAILSIGHDVDSTKAPDNIYNDLPECCKYRDHEHAE